MGSNLEGFNIRLVFGPDGDVEQVFYWDQEGCGHEREIDWDDSVADVVQRHLTHYDKAHDRRPPVRCGYVIKTIAAETLRCTREPHNSGGNHHFEMRS